MAVCFLRFFVSKTFRLSILCVFLVAAIVLIGFTIYASICDQHATWHDITSPTDEIIPSDTQEVVGPFGDGFVADMRNYEDFINPIGKNRDAFLRLISSNIPLKSGDIPADLTALPSSDTVSGKEIYLSLHAAKALEAMFIEIRAQDISLIDPVTKLPARVLVGYRSYEDQYSLFQKEVEKQMKKDSTLSREMAEAIASATVMRPGTDEHQSGLAVSFAFGNTTSTTFANTDLFRWLSENAWKFGFILRYPADKSAITGISFRPWHFRYVGRTHASLMKENQLSLEEYLEVVVLN